MEKVVRNGCDGSGRGIIVNSSRRIIFAGKGEDFDLAAGRAAKELRDTINRYRQII